jgi:hypothetical protein
MKLRMTWFLGGCAMALMAGMNMMACSSSNSPGGGGGSGGSGGSGGKDSGGVDSKAPGDTGPGSDAMGGGDTGPSDAGGDVNCGKPSDLHPEKEAGIYCPFSAVGDGGDKTCTGGQVCCQTLSADAGASTCEPAGTAVTACPSPSDSVVWECEDPIDCVGSSGGALCCGFGTAEKEAPSCSNYDYVSGSKGKGSVCASSCAGGNIICETQAECTAAEAGTCTPVKDHGNSIGFCMP